MLMPACRSKPLIVLGGKENTCAIVYEVKLTLLLLDGTTSVPARPLEPCLLPCEANTFVFRMCQLDPRLQMESFTIIT